MTLSNDGANGQRRASVDAQTADRLLDGLISPEDAPAGFAGVARVVIAARRPASPSELADEGPAVAAAVRLLGTLAAEPHHPRQRIRPRRRFVRVNVLALAVVGTVLGTSGLAVAGVLPEPAQEVAAEVLSKVGIHVPGSGDEREQPESAGNDVSETAQTTDAEGAAKGAEISHLASAGKSHAGEGGLGREGAPGQDQPHGQSKDNASETGEDDTSENGANRGRRDEAGTPAGGPPADAGTDPGGESDGAAQDAGSSGEHAQGGSPPPGGGAPDHARNDRPGGGRPG